LSAATASAQREFFDLAYSSEPASYYYLLLEIDARQLKACWYHLSKNLVTGFASYPLDSEHPGKLFAKLLSDHPFLKSEFKQTVITVRSHNYALIPKTHESPDRQALFEITNTFQPENQVLLSHDLINLKASVNFAIGTEWAEVIRHTFFHPVIVPHIAPRIENALNTLKSGETKDMVLAHVSPEHVDVLVFRDQKLCLANAFFQSGKEDIAYYLLYCCEVLGVDPERVPLHISGETERGSGTWSLLSDYWKHFSAAQRLEYVKVSPKLDGYPAAGFDYITQNLLCAS